MHLYFDIVIKLLAVALCQAGLVVRAQVDPIKGDVIAFEAFGDLLPDISFDLRAAVRDQQHDAATGIGPVIKARRSSQHGAANIGVTQARADAAGHDRCLDHVSAHVERHYLKLVFTEHHQAKDILRPASGKFCKRPAGNLALFGFGILVDQGCLDAAIRQGVIHAGTAVEQHQYFGTAADALDRCFWRGDAGQTEHRAGNGKHRQCLFQARPPRAEPVWRQPVVAGKDLLVFAPAAQGQGDQQQAKQPPRRRKHQAR